MNKSQKVSKVQKSIKSINQYDTFFNEKNEKFGFLGLKKKEFLKSIKVSRFFHRCMMTSMITLNKGFWISHLSPLLSFFIAEWYSHFTPELFHSALYSKNNTFFGKSKTIAERENNTSFQKSSPFRQPLLCEMALW